MPGWIALRYLNDPATARKYFADIDKGSVNPIMLARANYWRAARRRRSATRTGRAPTTRRPRAISDRLLRAAVRGPSSASTGSSCARRSRPIRPATALSDERVRAADMLYAIGERDMPVKFASDLAEECTDEAVLAALGELTFRRNDAKTMLQLGKTALGRGLAMDHYAFPTIGIPAAQADRHPEIEHSIIYSVARTESAFDQRVKSHANAVGLMQITPEAAQDTAKRFGVNYELGPDGHRSRLQHANGRGRTQRADEGISSGSHIMTFAGYNAGRGRVRDWVKAARRSARPQRRSGRLGGADPVCRNAQLCAARDGKPRGISCPLRYRHHRAIKVRARSGSGGQGS